MTKLKTTPNERSVTDFLESLDNEQEKAGSYALLEKMQRLSGAKPVMWGDSIIGFGSYQYKYKSGQEGAWPLTGFSPRKANLSLYLMGGLLQQVELLERLGKHKKGKGCLYIKKLSDVDESVLEEMIALGIRKLKEKYPED